MPKDSDRRELTREELEQEQKEKFKTFFTTSVAQVPEEMIPHAAQPDRKHGLLSRFFAKKEKARSQDPPEQEEVLWAETPIAPTGEILLDSAPGPVREESGGGPALTPRPLLEDLTLQLEGPPEEPAPKAEAKSAVPAPKAEAKPAAPAPKAEAKPAAPAPKAEAKPAAPAPKADTKPAAMTFKAEEKPRAERPAPPVLKVTPPKSGTRPHPKTVRVPDAEDKELAKLRDMLEVMGPQPVQPARPAPAPSPAPEEDKEVTQQVGGFHFFGVGEDEAPRGQTPPPGLDDTMSLELHEEDGQEPEAPAAPAKEKAAPEHMARGRRKKNRSQPAPAAPERQEEEPAEAPAAAPEQPAPAEELPQTPEEAARALEHTVAALNLRCALSGILALALIWAGLVYEGILPPMAGLNPAVAPAAFMGAVLLLLAGALAVSRNTMRDGLLGLVKAPSYDTMPALAGAAALVQAAVAMLNPDVYQSTTLTLMSGAAALALFLNNLGSRLLAVSVRDGYKVASSGVAHEGAYRAQDKDLIRTLAPTLEEKDPWILLSRPMEGDGSFLEQSFGPRAGEKKVQTLARVLLGCAAVGAVWMLLTGKGLNGAAAALASILCLGAPLSSTLIAGLTALRTERTAGALGAVIPGWAGIEELNGIDTIQVDAGELFTPESAQLEDIRIFKGGRIDRAILYTASVLNQGCNTLSRLFRTIIADRTDILPPVKDLERHTGLGFSAWCDNNRILIGTRAYMEQEGVALPEASYEARHSQDGQLQILYLAVAGNMYAMFVLRYIGGKHAARCLSILQKENIRLMVTCQDPSLTAEKIAAAYHLPDGLVTVLDEAQCKALAPAVSAVGDAPCCMLHLKGFTSLTGGLRAAQRAQAAESAGVAIQMVSTGFSALIGLLLSYSGSVGTLSLLVVLMYQAAWSALGMVAAAMKQHN